MVGAQEDLARNSDGVGSGQAREGQVTTVFWPYYGGPRRFCARELRVPRGVPE